MKELLIHRNEVTICTENVGDSSYPAILLVAGATVSMLYWDDAFCKQLATQGYYVIRYDHRDVGQSTVYEPGTTPYDIVDLVDDAVAILEGYGLSNAHWVGMSLGGLIAQIAAIKYPDRVASLTLFATGPWADTGEDIPLMDTQIIDFQQQASGVDWSDEESVVAYLLLGALLMSGKKPPFNVAAEEKRIRAEFKRARNYLSMFNHAALQGGEEYWNRLDEIKQPALIIHGTEDKIWHYKNASVLVDQLADATLLTLEDTGHELHQDDWETIIASIDEHIGRYK